ncbi:GNAT family N-acetyltransferase [Microbacterium sp.]|uniref:GNAT family N-acetyltransferase n=1 Tax=Microbacterium sp. TaxID=51671 RepID=UPI0039E31A7A
MASPRIVRIDGDTVVRPVKPWTATVHSLLRHLHDAGLPVPEPFGIDAGFERVRLVRGAAGQDCWPHQLETSSVASAGRLLRRLHDATQDWMPPADAVWAVPVEAPSDGVICHGDFQPANLAWRDGVAVGAFDWDDARPAPRISDIAYALEYLTPFETDSAELARRGFRGRPARRERIEAFLDGYGWDQPFDVVEAVATRQQRAIDEVVLHGEGGHEPAATWVAAGWPERWKAKLEVTRSLTDEVQPGTLSSVELRPLTHADAEAHCAGEDEQTVRWLTGGYGTVEGTRAYFDVLAGNAAAGRGKRGFGLWRDGRLAGYVDFDPDNADGLQPGDVNISYAVHPWARGSGVASEAVLAICQRLRDEDIGRRVAIRVEPENVASVRVAEKCGFRPAGSFTSSTDTHPDGTPVVLSLYLLDL